MSGRFFTVPAGSLLAAGPARRALRKSYMNHALRAKSPATMAAWTNALKEFDAAWVGLANEAVQQAAPELAKLLKK